MGINEDYGERLVRLETKWDTELTAIKEAINDLKKIVLSKDETYVSKQLMDAELKLRDKEIHSIQNELNEIRDNKKANKQILPNWGQVLVAIVALAVSIIALYKG